MTEVTIIGAGISGLLIARHLVDKGASVTLVGPEDKRQQTLCTWRNMRPPEYYNEHVIGRWNTWQFGANDTNIVQQSDSYWYEALDGLSLKIALEQYLSTQPRLTRIKELANTEKKPNQAFQIDTASSSFTSLYLLDSRPPHFSAKGLIQQFYGIATHCDQAHIITKHPILMDFNIPQINPDSVAFIYVIPLGQESVLVEATLFGISTVEESILKNLAQNWIKENCSSKHVNNSLIFEEKGIIPMGPVAFTNNGKPAGIAAGSARQSSGYSLRGLERQIKQFEDFNDLTALSHSPYSSLSTWMDKLFLKVIRNNPSLGKPIFSAMGQSLTGDQFAAFMADDFSIKDGLKIIRALPKIPFLRALVSK
ncbi:lycopene cyclase family protein [Burkholderiales bacterium]|nr:lycopene cyclase family protein [Burkholderiales bacterium]